MSNLSTTLSDRQSSTFAIFIGHTAFPVFLQSSVVFFVHLALMFGGFSPSAKLWQAFPYLILSFLSIQATRLILARCAFSCCPGGR